MTQIWTSALNCASTILCTILSKTKNLCASNIMHFRCKNNIEHIYNVIILLNLHLEITNRVMSTHNRKDEFEQAMQKCRELFVKKLHDYGVAWRIMRPETMTDQLYIKAARIRSLQIKGCSKIDEGIVPEFIGIVNYSIIALIQLELGAANTEDISTDKATELYDVQAQKALKLMLMKNHDYDEAWRGMRVESYADLIFMKILRTKQIENLKGRTLVSEGIAANYMDMMNYAVFGLIKLIIEK